MDLIERLVYLFLGGFIGFVLGYICARLDRIKEEVDEIVQHERDEDGSVRINSFFHDILLLGVVILVAYAAFASQKVSRDLEDDIQQDQRERCLAQEEQRNTDRDLVDSVFNLAVGAAQRSKGDPPRTPDEIERVNRYIDSVNDFRQDMYNQIGPADVCRPFVQDDSKKPPTPPAPYVDR